LRGGSWNNNQNNARAAYRNNNNPDNRNNNIGFRLASHVSSRVQGAMRPAHCVAESILNAPAPEIPAGHGLRDEANEGEAAPDMSGLHA
jgi:hypothetical protein